MAFPDSWLYKKKISIKTGNLDASQTNFPLKVPLASDTVVGGRCLSTGYDIRFANSAGTEIPYDRESFAVSGGAATGIFWVKCDPSTAGTDIYLYYGNTSATDGNNPTAVWDSDYVAVYHMNDATTSTILDSTSNNNDGDKTAANTPLGATAKIGTGQNNENTATHISCGTDDSFDIAGPITISMWIKTADGTTNHGVVCYAGGGYNTGYMVTVSNGGVPYMRLSRYGTSGVNFDCTAHVFDDEWHYIVARYTGSGHDWTIDGSAAGSNTTTLTVGSATGATAWLFNRMDTGTGMTGLMDEVRVSAVSRSDEWLKFEYYNMSSTDSELTWGDEEDLIPVRRPHGRFNRPR